MNNIGSRIIFDNNGKIWSMHGEFSTSDINYKREDISKLSYIDLEFGTIDFNTHYIESIDVTTNTPVIKQYEVELTEEELKMQSLEKRNADLSYELMINGGN